MTRLYQSTNVDEAVRLIQKYNIDLTYIGDLERAYYSEESLYKFQLIEASGLISNVYQTERVSIYQVESESKKKL